MSFFRLILHRKTGMLFKYTMGIVHDGTMERGGTGMPEQNNKLKLVRAVMLCVTLAIMAAIFLFSAQPGESSSALSQQITEKWNPPRLTA